MTELRPVAAAPIDQRNVLIVIPCLNEEPHLPALLAQLLTEAPEASIVVADGGSTDRSVEIVTAIGARHQGLQLLDNTARIQSAGINLAVRRFGRDKDWLLRIDAHCTYPPGYVAALLGSAAAYGADAVVVPMVTQGSGCFQRAAAAAQNSLIGTGGSPHRRIGQGRFVDHGHHALMRLDRFMVAGGYREALSHNEDAELDIRLTNAGARIWLEPRCAIVYHPRGTPGGLWRQYFNYGRGRARTMRLHGLKLKPRQTIPLAVPAAMAMLPFALLAWPFALPALAWAAACMVSGIAIGTAARDACAAGAGIAAMIMHASWSAGYIAGRIGPAQMRPTLPPLEAA